MNTRPRLVLAGREGAEYVFGTTSAGRCLLGVLDALPQETATLLGALNPPRMYVVGGRAAVSDAVVEQAVAARPRSRPTWSPSGPARSRR